MEYSSIADVYEANDKIHEKLCSTVSELSDEQKTAMPDGEKWSISQIIEHMSMVDGGIYRICAKLLSKAETGQQLNEGEFSLDGFVEKVAGIQDKKLEAPDFVQPRSGLTVTESLGLLEQNQNDFRELKPLFEKYDSRSHTFPHPYFGELSAREWLVLSGGHKMRHLRQIKVLADKIGSAQV